MYKSILTRRNIPSAKLLFGMALLFGLLASAYAQVAVYVTEDPGVIGKYKTSGKPINSKFITGAKQRRRRPGSKWESFHRELFQPNFRIQRFHRSVN
jgi:hypothetical protein